jgi:hypothetical protein
LPLCDCGGNDVDIDFLHPVRNVKVVLWAVFAWFSRQLFEASPILGRCGSGENRAGSRLPMADRPTVSTLPASLLPEANGPSFHVAEIPFAGVPAGKSLLNSAATVRTAPAASAESGAVPSPVVAWAKARLKEAPSWLASLILHLSVLALLGSIILSSDRRDGFFGTTLTRGEIGTETGVLDGTEIGPDVLPAPRGEPRFEPQGTEAGKAPDTGHPPVDLQQPGLNVASLTSSVAAVPDLQAEAAADMAREGRGRATRATSRKSGAGKEQGANLEGILNGRSPEMRAKLVKAGGGTKESERAVALGLAWLARHQNPDGSWSFQHGPDEPGTLESPNGATGLALLAFLGAGNTPKEGEYKSHVRLGLKYLVDHMEVTSRGGWMGATGIPTMYVQAICAIALCEACSMTRDPALRRPAQQAIDFIVNAQDPETGGWRYRIPQAGDTSVVGWQLMALQSAKIAELSVPPRVITRATRFLRSVESEGGAAYGYTSVDNVRPTTTAVGLLCRMYLGREPTHKGMMRGMKRLSEWGPNPDDMYYNYYGTQALHHWGDKGWERWNTVMRDFLIHSQSQDGDSAGSWAPDSSHGVRMGGRLYTSCLAIMTLEVYYRYLPLYRQETLPDD